MTERPVRLRPGRRIWLMVLVHPLELALASALVINGIRGAAGDVSPSLAFLPDWQVSAYLIVSTAGGAATGVGLFLQTRLRTVDVGVAIERAAMSLVGSAYLALAFLVTAQAGIGIGLVSTLIGVGILIRAYAIKLTAAVTLDQLQRKNHDA